ncbi:oxidoreductase [Edaphobacter flagellatus]|uniref:oxidoreductase n=1 Tax=Edaphobacter flagellatus TaxID=1933044 RepID=UPI0021B368AA|nr:oxidoreductase [Edaphobacter flagellatus]
MSDWTPEQIPSLRGRRFVITGANTGIGYHAALKLARREADLVLACRDPRKGEAALGRLMNEAPGANAELAILDLASLDSVRRFAAEELAKQRPLHVLINNAGVMALPQRLETTDGFEMQFGTNVLGHFALTGLLLPAMERSSTIGNPSRVVTIASIAHKRTHLRLDDLQSMQSYSPMRVYQQTKLADLMFSFELSRRLRAEGSSVMSVAAHPGVAATDLFRTENRSGFVKTLRSVIGEAISIFLNTDAEGALPTLYAATAADVVDGGYYGPQGFEEMRGETVGPAKVAPQALDKSAAARLWELCEGWTGVCFP